MPTATISAIPNAVSLFSCSAHHRHLHSFPTRRSSDLPHEALAHHRNGHRGRQDTRHRGRSEEHTSELQSRFELVCRLLLEKKKAPLRTAGDGTARCGYILSLNSRSPSPCLPLATVRVP